MWNNNESISFVINLQKDKHQIILITNANEEFSSKKGGIVKLVTTTNLTNSVVNQHDIDFKNWIYTNEALNESI